MPAIWQNITGTITLLVSEKEEWNEGGKGNGEGKAAVLVSKLACHRHAQACLQACSVQDVGFSLIKAPECDLATCLLAL